MTTTDIIPEIVMAVLLLIDVAAIWYSFTHRNAKYHEDLIVGFFSCMLTGLLALLWYVGWNTYIDGVYFTATNYYMAGFLGFAFIILSFLEVAFLFLETDSKSKDVGIK
jgi:hypothetical protein